MSNTVKKIQLGGYNHHKYREVRQRIKRELDEHEDLAFSREVGEQIATLNRHQSVEG